MFSLKSACLFFVVAIATFSSSLAHAQVFCLDYPVYYDGMGNYLFLSDAFASDPAGCNQFEGEWYIFLAANEIPDSVPQPCGTGACLITMSSDVLALIPAKGEKDSSSPASATAKFDRPIPNVPADMFNFGKDPKNNSFPSVPPTTPERPTPPTVIPNPSAGIFSQTGDLIWIQSTKGLIPIRLYRIILDYDLAGVPASVQPKSGRQRTLFLGMQVKTTAERPENGIAPTLQSGIKYSGKVHYANPSTPKDIHAYNIVTQTPLQ